MAARKQLTPNYVPQTNVTDPYYGDYSALAQQLYSGQQPVYSVGQGLANVAGDLGKAYFEKRALDKAKDSEKKDYTDLAMAQQLATNPNPVVEGISPQHQPGMPDPQNPGMQYAKVSVPDEGFNPTTVSGPQAHAQMALQYLGQQNPRLAVQQGPNMGLLARSAQPPSFSGELGPGHRAFIDGKEVASAPPESKLKSKDEEAQAIRIAQASRPPAPAEAASFAFDRSLGKNRRVTNAEMNANPENFAPPVQSPQVKLFNKSGQEIGTGDPNDPAVQARVTSGEIRTAPPRQFSGEQSKAAGFANDALTSEANVERLLNPSVEPGKPVPKKFDPTGMEGWAVSNTSSSAELQKYEQAMSNWGMAVLRQESGGAITPAEGLEYARTFFPRFGDKPGTVQQKRAQRQEKVRGIISASGGAYDANFGKQDQPEQNSGWSIKKVGP